MAKIILIQALPAPRLDSRENLTRALTLLQGCQGQEADLICFPEYFPFSGRGGVGGGGGSPPGAYHRRAGGRSRRDAVQYRHPVRPPGPVAGPPAEAQPGQPGASGLRRGPRRGLAGVGHRLRTPGPAGVHRFLGPARGGPAPGGRRGRISSSIPPFSPSSGATGRPGP